MAHSINFNVFSYAPSAQNSQVNVFSATATAEKDSHIHFFNIVENKGAGNKGIADKLSTATGIHGCSESSHLSCC